MDQKNYGGHLVDVDSKLPRWTKESELIEKMWSFKLLGYTNYTLELKGLPCNTRGHLRQMHKCQVVNLWVFSRHWLWGASLTWIELLEIHGALMM
jgi:hypothetical protein